jgi:hypothetical protein
MICPECAAEYRDGFTRCSDCQIDLVDPAITTEHVPETRLVKVYESGNAAIIPFVQSLLADAGIDFMTKGEPLQDLFGWGRFGANLNYVIGPVQFYVREEDQEEAVAIFRSLDTLSPPPVESE